MKRRASLEEVRQLKPGCQYDDGVKGEVWVRVGVRDGWVGL